MTAPLKYLSEAKLVELRSSVPANLARYASGDFRDVERDNGWAIESVDVKVDHDRLAALDATLGTPERDADASIIVYQSMKGMTPALAREERVWVRLTHIECLDYSRARWLSRASADKLEGQVRLHMFAGGLTGIRDDNAVARLWWNMHVATVADSEDPVGALRLILTRADTRMQIVERPGTAARRPLARALIRAMRRHEWINSTEDSFRRFMRVLNRDGGGVLFEALTEPEADALVERCMERAQALPPSR